MSLFFVDFYLSHTCTYEELLDYLNTEEKVVLNYRRADTLGFFKNFLLAVVNNQSVTLHDLCQPDEEFNIVHGIPYVENIVCLPKKRAKVTMKNLSSRILSSKSKVEIYTSGTTGIPKAVEHTIENLTREVRIGKKYADDKWAYAYNPTHMAGVQLFFQAVCNYNMFVNVFSLQKEQIIYLIQKFGLTNISATPSFYRLLLPLSEPLMEVKKLTLGGEKSPEMLVDAIRKSFPNAHVYNIYASTEFGSILSSRGSYFVIPEKYREQIRIKNGVLEVHSSLLGVVHGNKQISEWYSTGDVVEFEPGSDTCFKFNGRQNELINVGGNKVNPSEIETELFASFPQIKDCFVFGRMNSVLGSIVSAEIVLREGEVLSEAQVKAVLFNRLQDYKVPRRIEIVSHISKNRAGKILRKRDE